MITFCPHNIRYAEEHLLKIHQSEWVFLQKAISPRIVTWFVFHFRITNVVGPYRHWCANRFEEPGWRVGTKISLDLCVSELWSKVTIENKILANFFWPQASSFAYHHCSIKQINCNIDRGSHFSHSWFHAGPLVELEFKVLDFAERRKLENPDKKARMAPGLNRTQATLVGGERSHHCASPASKSRSKQTINKQTKMFFNLSSC